MTNIFDIIGNIGLMPVIVVEREEDAVPLAEALIEGGLPLAEVTFRTAAAAKVIAAMAKVPGLTLGAGTVLTPAQVDQAIDLGAQFALAPSFVPKTAEYALKKNFPFVPGILSPSEISAALEGVMDFLRAEPTRHRGFYLTSIYLPGARVCPGRGK